MSVIGKGARRGRQLGLVQRAGVLCDRGAFGGDLRAPGLQMVQQRPVGPGAAGFGGAPQRRRAAGLVGDRRGVAIAAWNPASWARSGVLIVVCRRGRVLWPGYRL